MLRSTGIWEAGREIDPEYERWLRDEWAKDDATVEAEFNPPALKFFHPEEQALSDDPLQRDDELAQRAWGRGG